MRMAWKANARFEIFFFCFRLNQNYSGENKSIYWFFGSKLHGELVSVYMCALCAYALNNSKIDRCVLRTTTIINRLDYLLGILYTHSHRKSLNSRFVFDKKKHTVRLTYVFPLKRDERNRRCDHETKRTARNIYKNLWSSDDMMPHMNTWSARLRRIPLALARRMLQTILNERERWTHATEKCH